VAVAIKGKKITILLDWIYQNLAIEEEQTTCDELAFLLKEEVKWMRRAKLTKVYRSWARENRTHPRFKVAEKQLKEMLPIF
jgi:hypothetical protein